MFSPELKKRSIERIVLTILQERSRHGYDIGRLIEIRSQGRLRFRVTSLYPVLYRMERRDGSGAAGWRRKGNSGAITYSLTPVGKKTLAAQRELWKEYTAAVNLVIRESHA